MDEQKNQEELQEELESQAAEQAENESVDAAQDNAADQEAPEEQEDALSVAEAEIAKLKEDVLRAHAEMQNIRRRADADVEKAHKFALEKFALEMLTTVDNLERALAACTAQDDATKAIHDGVDMMLKALLASLAKFKIEVVNPEGEFFNPEYHQAITMVESPDAASNTVLTVMQKGYTLSGRLLRPAMVVVSKGAPQVDEKA